MHFLFYKKFLNSMGNFSLLIITCLLTKLFID